MPVTFIPSSAFQPDGGDYGPVLAATQNALPAFGSWRPLQQKSQIASVADGPVTGAYTHVYQQARQVKYLRPDGDNSVGTWLASTGSTLYDKINEAAANDSNYITAGNGPSSQACKVSLSNPGSTSGTNHFIRWRYRIPVAPSSAYTVTFDLMQNTTVIATDTITGAAAVTGWTQRELALTGPQIASISDYTALFFRFTATVPGSLQYARPTSDVSTGGWVDQAAGTTNLYTRIDESVADDSDYILTPVLAEGGASYTYTAGHGTVTDPAIDTNHTWRYRYQAANAGVTIVARLKCGSTTVKEVTHTNASTALTTNAVALSTAEAALITDYTQIRTEFVASWPSSGPASTVTQNLSPISDDLLGGWAVTPLWSKVNRIPFDDANFIAGSTTIDACRLRLATGIDPKTQADHKLNVRAKGSGKTLSVSLVYFNGSSYVPITTQSIFLTGSFATTTYTLSSIEASACVGHYGALYVELTGNGTVSDIDFEIPQVRYGKVTWTELEVASASRVDVSWSEMEIPDGNTSYLGDIPTIIAGTKTKLYEVKQSGWTDLSKGGGYAGASVNPAGWWLCSFGTHVIATNYVDPVQYRQDNAGSFKDLIVSTLKPKARFAAAVRNYLMLGGINLSGHYDDEVWWSYIDDATQFDVGNRQFQSDKQRLVSQPGQIMGLVGGDFALVFKRNSIHALDWVGGDVVFKVRDLTGSIGTAHPRSIVSADGLVYFWGGSTFYRTDGYNPPQPIGSDVLSRFLSDPDFSTGGIAQIQPSNIGEEDQVMVGWFDKNAGLLFWEYQGTSDALYKHTRLVVYNPREDRWSYGVIPSGNIAYAIGKPNVTTNETYLLKGTIGFDWDGTNSTWFRFLGGSTYDVTFTTKRQTIGLDDNDRPQAAQIRGVMPVFSVSTNDATWPDLTVTVQAAEDPRLLLNPQTDSYSRSSANEQGWFPINLGGNWFVFSVAVPPMSSKVMTAFQGIYVDWQPRGRS